MGLLGHEEPPNERSRKGKKESICSVRSSDATAWLFAFFYPSDFAKLSCNNSTLDDSSSCLEVTVSHACKVHIFEVFSDARSVFGYILLEKVTRFKVSPLVC